MWETLRLTTLCALGLAISTAANAHTVTLTWTWPTLRQDSTALPLTAIGAFVVYDATLPVPGQPGTIVACPVTVPPTTATSACTTPTLSAGTHTFVVQVNDNSTPVNPGAVSGGVSVTVPASGPAAVTNLTPGLN